MSEVISEKIKYESDWIEAKQAAALFETPQQFVRAVVDGRIKTTGRLWVEMNPEETDARAPIDPAEWEKFDFDSETGDLKLIDWDAPSDVYYVSVRVLYSDIATLSSGVKISKPKTLPAEPEKPRGGRPPMIDLATLAANIAAYYVTEGPKVFVIDAGTTAKEFMNELDPKIPYMHSTGADIRTVERAIGKFIALYRKAEKEMNEAV